MSASKDIWEGFPLCVVCGKPTQFSCECGVVVCVRCNCPNWPSDEKEHPKSERKERGRT